MKYFDLPRDDSLRSIFLENNRLLGDFLADHVQELANLDVSHALEEAMQEGYFGFEIIRSPLLRWAVSFEGGHSVGITTCVDRFMSILFRAWQKRGIHDICITRRDDRIFVATKCQEEYVKRASRSMKSAEFYSNHSLKYGVASTRRRKRPRLSALESFVRRPGALGRR